VTTIEIDPKELQSREAYHLLTALVAPRPIAWVSTVSETGVRNLAPHSYFNAISSNPLIVHFTSTGTKDSLTNARSTREFVVNMVNEDLGEQMNLTAADFPPDEDEFEWVGVQAVPSRIVTPPRVAAAPAAFECKVLDVVSHGNGSMVFGEVVWMHIREGVMRDGRVDPELFRPIGRLGGATYSAAARGLFEMRRPRWDEIRERGKGG